MSDQQTPEDSASINAKVTGKSTVALFLMVILGSGGSTYAANELSAPQTINIERLERIEEKVNRLLTETERKGDDIKDLKADVADHEQRLRALEAGGK